MHIWKTGTRVLLVLCAVAIAGVASGQVVSLDPADSEIPAVGGTVPLTIAVADIQDLFGWQIDVAYDSSVLSYSAFAEGDFLKAAGLTREDLRNWPPPKKGRGRKKN